MPTLLDETLERPLADGWTTLRVVFLCGCERALRCRREDAQGVAAWARHRLCVECEDVAGGQPF